jgi:hypothetical protein
VNPTMARQPLPKPSQHRLRCIHSNNAVSFARQGRGDRSTGAASQVENRTQWGETFKNGLEVLELFRLQANTRIVVLACDAVVRRCDGRHHPTGEVYASSLERDISASIPANLSCAFRAAASGVTPDSLADTLVGMWVTRTVTAF